MYLLFIFFRLLLLLLVSPGFFLSNGARASEQTPANPASKTSRSLREKLIEQRFREARKEKENLDQFRRRSFPESEKIRLQKPVIPSKEEMAKDQEAFKKSLNEFRKSLDPKKRELLEQKLKAANPLSEEEVKEIIRNGGKPKKRKEERKSSPSLGVKPVGKPSKAPAPSEGASAKTFKKGDVSNPTEYGNSTATPGEAEKEVIEFPGKPKK